MQKRHPRFVAGFTLIELMMSIAVLAILVAVAVPSFSGFFEKSRVRGAADDIVSFLAEVRGEAVKRDRDVNVTLGGSVSAWCLGANSAVDPAVGSLVGAAAACDCAVAGVCLIGADRFVVDNSRYSDVAVDAVGDEITFDRKLGTLATLGTASLALASSSDRWGLRVDVSPLGHARACVPTGKLPLSGYRSC